MSEKSRTDVMLIKTDTGVGDPSGSGGGNSQMYVSDSWWRGGGREEGWKGCESAT